MDARPQVRQIKSTFAQMIEHWEAVIRHTDNIARLCGDILSQTTQVQDYAKHARNQLTDTVEEYQNQEEASELKLQEGFRENLKQIAG